MSHRIGDSGGHGAHGAFADPYRRHRGPLHDDHLYLRRLIEVQDRVAFPVTRCDAFRIPRHSLLETPADGLDDAAFDLIFRPVRIDGQAAVHGGEQPNVVVVESPAFLRAVLQQTTTLPIVMANVSDPVGNKFIHSLSRPGTSVTGVATLYEEVVPKVVEALHLLAPSATQVGVLVNEFNPSAQALVSAAQQAFRSLGKTATAYYASSLPQVEGAFKRMHDARVHAGLVIMDPVFFFLRNRIVSLARDLAVPFAYGSREYVDAGGLVSYGPNLPANFRASARYVAQILKGAHAADLPVEMPPRFELVLNRKSAEAFQIAVPPSVLVRAEVV